MKEWGWLRELPAHSPSCDRDLLLRRPTSAQIRQKKMQLWNRMTGKKELWLERLETPSGTVRGEDTAQEENLSL
jgi:hypothetical protein